MKGTKIFKPFLLGVVFKAKQALTSGRSGFKLTLPLRRYVQSTLEVTFNSFKKKLGFEVSLKRTVGLGLSCLAKG